VFAALNKHLYRLLDASTFMIYQLEPGGQTLNMVYGVEAGQISASHMIRVDDLQRNAARCAREQQDILSEVAPEDCVPIAGSLTTLSQMYAPLLVGERLLGVLTIQSENCQAYGERERAILRTLCSYSAIALANADTQSKLVEKNLLLEQLSVTDRLTGLYNRLKLDQVLEEELNRSGRSTKSFALVLLDVDHFKLVNDSFGHPVGDQVLVEIARLLAQGTRNADVVGRWGGEEFLIICRDTDLDGALVLAEKLREMISEHSFSLVGRKTASFGVTAFRADDNVHLMLARTDGALYRSKEKGRNCVEIAV
jgi:diguanylate cyclase (GGDEF)-like protein